MHWTSISGEQTALALFFVVAMGGLVCGPVRDSYELLFDRAGFQARRAREDAEREGRLSPSD